MTHANFGPLYIGYPTLEAWAGAVKKNEPIYAMLLTEPGKSGQNGYHADDLLVLCFQPDTQNRVHYCRMLVGRLTFLGDQPFGLEHEHRKAQAEHAWVLIQNWLKEQDFVVNEAVIATPVDYRFLNGFPEFLIYKKDKGFFRKDVPPA